MHLIFKQMMKKSPKQFSNSKDYYKILGVEQNSTIHQIKKAFKEKVKISHPDVVSENKENFKLIVEAY